MVHFAFEMILCFLAILGAVFVLREISDFYTLRRAGFSLSLIVTDLTAPDSTADGDSDASREEYALRVLESILYRSPLYGTVREIVLYGIDPALYEKLQKEYGNLRVVSEERIGFRNETEKIEPK